MSKDLKQLLVIYTLVIITIIGFCFYYVWYTTPHVVAAGATQGQCAGYPDGICESCTLGQCTGKDATPPNPNRPYFDGYGNEFTYNGTLMSIGLCNGSGNPYCPQPSQPTPTPFIGK